MGISLILNSAKLPRPYSIIVGILSLHTVVGILETIWITKAFKLMFVLLKLFRIDNIL